MNPGCPFSGIFGPFRNVRVQVFLHLTVRCIPNLLGHHIFEQYNLMLIISYLNLQQMESFSMLDRLILHKLHKTCLYPREQCTGNNF